MTIRDILMVKGVGQHDVYSVSPDTPLTEAVAEMVERDTGGLAVVAKGRLVGMLTFREIMAALHRGGGTLAGVTAGEVMIAEPIFGSPEDSVDYVRQVMTENHVRYLPVLDDEETLVGVISFHDVARAVLAKAVGGSTLLKRYGPSSW